MFQDWSNKTFFCDCNYVYGWTGPRCDEYGEYTYVLVAVNLAIFFIGALIFLVSLRDLYTLLLLSPRSAKDWSSAVVTLVFVTVASPALALYGLFMAMTAGYDIPNAYFLQYDPVNNITLKTNTYSLFLKYPALIAAPFSYLSAITVSVSWMEAARSISMLEPYTGGIGPKWTTIIVIMGVSFLVTFSVLIFKKLEATMIPLVPSFLFVSISYFVAGFRLYEMVKLLNLRGKDKSTDNDQAPSSELNESMAPRSENTNNAQSQVSAEVNPEAKERRKRLVKVFRQMFLTSLLISTTSLLIAILAGIYSYGRMKQAELRYLVGPDNVRIRNIHLAINFVMAVLLIEVWHYIHTVAVSIRGMKSRSDVPQKPPKESEERGNKATKIQETGNPNEPLFDILHGHARSIVLESLLENYSIHGGDIGSNPSNFQQRSHRSVRQQRPTLEQKSDPCLSHDEASNFFHSSFMLDVASTTSKRSQQQKNIAQKSKLETHFDSDDDLAIADTHKNSKDSQPLAII